MISYVLASLAATANALSNVLNSKATRDEPAALQFRLALILDLLHRRTWLMAVGMMMVSFVLAAAALGTGEIAAVQPIVVLELPMTLIGGSVLLRTRLSAREWAAVAAMTAGVIGLLATLHPRAGSTTTISSAAWLAGSAACGSAILALVLAARSMARRPGREAVQAALLGLGAGVAYGLTAAYTKGFMAHFASGGPAGALTSWPLYATVGTGCLATWLLQNSYHAGRLAAGQPGITLADPLVGMTWGILVAHEQVRGSAFLGIAIIPLAMLAAGVFILSRSLARSASPRSSVAGPGGADVSASAPAVAGQDQSSSIVVSGGLDGAWYRVHPCPPGRPRAAGPRPGPDPLRPGIRLDHRLPQPLRRPGEQPRGRLAHGPAGAGRRPGGRAAYQAGRWRGRERFPTGGCGNPPTGLTQIRSSGCPGRLCRGQPGPAPGIEGAPATGGSAAGGT